jgi:hypothetical protein
MAHGGRGGFENGIVLCGALKSFFEMQNLVKASTSLNSAHPEQLIARSFGAYFNYGKRIKTGPRSRALVRATVERFKTVSLSEISIWA